MPFKIHVERKMHRSSIAVTGESAASYALITLTPDGDTSANPLPLNIAFVMDVSGSMYEEDGVGISRLARVQEAALAGIAMLKPEDTLTVVAYAHGAQVVLPPTRVADMAAIEDAIRRIDSFGVDPGGASLAEGISLGIAELRKNVSPGKISEVMVMTDGAATNEEECYSIAEVARNHRIQLTLLGLGTDWQAHLIKDMARQSMGRWGYLDVYQPEEIQRVFLKEFGRLSTTAVAHVDIQLRPIKDVRIKRLRQVVPEINDLQVEPTEGRGLTAHSGSLEKNQAKGYILEMSLPRRTDGKYVIAQMEITFDLGTGQRESSGSLPLEMQYTSSGPGYVDAEVAKHIDEVQIFELNNSLQKALAAANAAEAQRLAENIAKKGDLLGPRGALRTMLAKNVLDELRQAGRVSAKTQLAMDDAARLTEEEKSE
jgi:Ca-activated chloride channel family protein